MSLSAVQNKILQPFINETLANLRVMAGLEGHTEDGFIDEVDKFRFKGYAICAETHGRIEGVMLMHHYIETAVAMGNAIRKHIAGDDTHYDNINDCMADALAEWGNTVLGRATKALSERHLTIEFEPPYFVYDTEMMATLLEGVIAIITVPVHVDNVGRFYFNYLIREVKAASDTRSGVDEKVASVVENSVVIDKHTRVPLDTTKKILVVDDMKMIRTSMKKHLQKLGFINVIEAENGEEAVDKYMQEHPDFIFMDVVMPLMSGSEALKRIRATTKDTPIVMLTSVADQTMIDECEALGIDGYIVKPLTMDTGPQVLSRFLLL